MRRTDSIEETVFQIYYKLIYVVTFPHLKSIDVFSQKVTLVILSASPDLYELTCLNKIWFSMVDKYVQYGINIEIKCTGEYYSNTAYLPTTV